jgi:hypothetical protein
MSKLDTDESWSGWRARLYALMQRNPCSNRAVIHWARLEPDMRVLGTG